MYLYTDFVGRRLVPTFIFSLCENFPDSTDPLCDTTLHLPLSLNNNRKKTVKPCDNGLHPGRPSQVAMSVATNVNRKLIRSKLSSSSAVGFCLEVMTMLF